jgi:hypothetical protein
MKKTFNRMVATFGAVFTSERSKQRADRFVAWLAGASNHGRSMNG